MPIDYSRYPQNWRSEIVPRILNRAAHSCENCGIKNGAETTSVQLRVQDIDGRYKPKRFWVSNQSDLARILPFAYPKSEKTIKVVLTVAHLDHDEENHDVPDDRLRAWCQYCHLNYDASEKYRRACNKSTPADLFATQPDKQEGV